MRYVWVGVGLLVILITIVRIFWQEEYRYMKEIVLTKEQRIALFQDVTLKGDKILNYFFPGSFLFGMVLATIYGTGKVSLRLEAILNRNIAFAEEIKEGNFEAYFEAFEGDPLGEPLADMRDHLSLVYQKERQESYIQTGLNQLGETLRSHSQASMAELARATTTVLSKYLTDRSLCLEAGASNYLAKPINPEQLIQEICQLIHPEYARTS